MWTEIRQLWSQGFMKGSRRDKGRKTLNKRPTYLSRRAVFSLTRSCWNPDIFHSIDQKREFFLNFFFLRKWWYNWHAFYISQRAAHVPVRKPSCWSECDLALRNLCHYLIAACSCNWSSANASRYKSGSLLRWENKHWGRGEPCKLRKF